MSVLETPWIAWLTLSMRKDDWKIGVTRIFSVLDVDSQALVYVSFPLS